MARVRVTPNHKIIFVVVRKGPDGAAYGHRSLDRPALITLALPETGEAMVVVVPLITPIAAHYKIDGVHLGIVFLANMELGYLMPPMGENLFLASYRFKMPLSKVYLSTVPYSLMLMAAVLLWKPFTDDAQHHVGDSARRIHDDHFHHLVGIRLRVDGRRHHANRHDGGNHPFRALAHGCRK